MLGHIKVYFRHEMMIFFVVRNAEKLTLLPVMLGPINVYFRHLMNV